LPFKGEKTVPEPPRRRAAAAEKRNERIGKRRPGASLSIFTSVFFLAQWKIPVIFFVINA
jgi:hypothetical protein